jgi:hypothetical protein
VTADRRAPQIKGRGGAPFVLEAQRASQIDPQTALRAG